MGKYNEKSIQRGFLMKILNSSRFFVEIGDKLSYNKVAVKWINNNLVNGNKWNSIDQLNNKNPVVASFIEYKDKYSNKKYIQVSIKHDDGYTGYSGVIDKRLNADVWFLNINGTLDLCKYPLFKRKKC